MKSSLEKFTNFKVSMRNINGADYACIIDSAEYGYLEFYHESSDNRLGDYHVFTMSSGDTVYCSAVY